jgi:hypothetical protein
MDKKYFKTLLKQKVTYDICKDPINCLDYNCVKIHSFMRGLNICKTPYSCTN